MAVRVKRKNPNAVKSAYRKMAERTGKEVAVGFPKGKAQAYPDGTSLVMVASAHVHGIGVPKRDFMKMSQDEITEKTAPIIARASKLGNPESLYNAAGLSAQAAIQHSIVVLNSPPNSPATIDAKGEDNPLIDTHHMVEAVTYVVRDRTR